MTNRPTAIADVDAGSVSRTIRIKASPARTWRALTTPEYLTAWWGHPTDFPDGWCEGSVGTFEHDGTLYPVRIDVLREPIEFVITWGEVGENIAGKTSNIRFTLAAGGDDATMVTVVETGFEPAAGADTKDPSIEDNVRGWNLVLNALVDFVEAEA